MRFVLCVLLVSIASAPTRAETHIDLFTMGQGDEMFSKFGHAALCVVDHELAAGGLCYNYGTSDFSRPIGLGWDVVRGRAEFWVSVSDLVSMVTSFQYQDRTIYRQRLPLPPEQVESLRKALAVDALPENRAYVYNHYLDNCSTRPRDLIDEASDGALRAMDFDTGKTYRDYAYEGFVSKSPLLVPAGDLIMGRWVDREISGYEAMFIPYVLREAVERGFNAAPSVVYERRAPLPERSVARARLVSWVVLIVLSFLAWVSRFGAKLGIVLISLMGLAIYFGAIVSVLPELRQQELLLVLVPLDLVLLFSRERRVLLYARARLVMLALVFILAVTGIFVQPLWPFWLLATASISSMWWRYASPRPTT